MSSGFLSCVLISALERGEARCKQTNAFATIGIVTKESALQL